MRSLWVVLASSTFAVAGCQLVGGFEDFSAEGGAAGSSAAGAAGAAAGTSGGGGSAPKGQCPAPPEGYEDDEFEKIKGSDGACVLIMKRTVSVDDYYLDASEVPTLGGGDGPCAKVYGDTFACLTVGAGVCRQAPVSCVTNQEAAGLCHELGDDVRLCSLEELKQECTKTRRVREWAFGCEPNDGGGDDCRTLGNLPPVSQDPPAYTCDVTEQTRSDDRRPDLGFRCCVGPDPILPP